MSRSKRSSPEGADRREDWLRCEQPGRVRPWAYEELLFGSREERQRREALRSTARELVRERTELSELKRELDEHVERIAGLEARVEAFAEPAPEATVLEPPSSGAPRARLRTADLQLSGPLGRSYALARCEGFLVETPTGPLGFVEGLRFASRVDQPDLLEVRVGRFGRQILIPVEEVEDVLLGEERLLVRNTPQTQAHPFDELVVRLRRALHLAHPAS